MTCLELYFGPVASLTVSISCVHVHFPCAPEEPCVYNFEENYLFSYWIWLMDSKHAFFSLHRTRWATKCLVKQQAHIKALLKKKGADRSGNYEELRAVQTELKRNIREEKASSRKKNEGEAAAAGHHMYMNESKNRVFKVPHAQSEGDPQWVNDLNLHFLTYDHSLPPLLQPFTHQVHHTILPINNSHIFTPPAHPFTAQS